MEKIYVISTNDKRVRYLANSDKKLKFVIDKIGNLTCSIHDNAFEFISCEILGQMLSKKVAYALERRFRELCNGQITPENVGRLDNKELRNIGLSNAKAITYT